MHTLIPQLPSLLPAVSAALLVLVGLSLLLKTRFAFSRLLALGVITAFLSAVSPEGLEALLHWLAALPVWLLIVVGGFSLLGLLGVFASHFIGRGAANSMVGALACISYTRSSPWCFFRCAGWCACCGVFLEGGEGSACAA